VTDQAMFDRCPPLSWGVCMRDHGYPTATCALAATCCVNAPVPFLETVGREPSRAVSEWKYGEGERWKRAA
jgi:hypothetical protein